MTRETMEKEKIYNKTYVNHGCDIDIQSRQLPLHNHPFPSTYVDFGQVGI